MPDQMLLTHLQPMTLWLCQSRVAHQQACALAAKATIAIHAHNWAVRQTDMLDNALVEYCSDHIGKKNACLLTTLAVVLTYYMALCHLLWC